MASPFPGMDPYLEGYLWSDLHHRLAVEISKRLNQTITPRYVARVVTSTMIHELGSGKYTGFMIPDVEVLTKRGGSPLPSPSPNPAEVATGTMSAFTPATTIAEQPWLIDVEIPSVEIRDSVGNILVTSIEILSPVNKGGEGWDEYRAKRHRILNSQANLLEIDWLRRGKRLFPTEQTGKPYYVLLTRAAQRTQVYIWKIALLDSLPTVPVPLRQPDRDVPLPLQAIFSTIYEEARYDLSVDYQHAADPPLVKSDATWAAALLKKG